MLIVSFFLSLTLTRYPPLRILGFQSLPKKLNFEGSQSHSTLTLNQSVATVSGEAEFLYQYTILNNMAPQTDIQRLKSYKQTAPRLARLTAGNISISIYTRSRTGEIKTSSDPITPLTLETFFRGLQFLLNHQ